MPIDYALYPRNWLTEIRPRILRRAGARPEAGIEARCEHCTILNHCNVLRLRASGPVLVKIVLTIAHLDQDRLNNADDNLAALCQRCHLLWDRPFHLINAGLTRERKRKQPLLPGVNPSDWRTHAMSKKPPHSFNVLFDEDEMSMLDHLAHLTKTNKSIVLRQALKYRFAMEAQHVPTCADGRKCFVPHMHIQTLPPKGTPAQWPQNPQQPQALSHGTPQIPNVPDVDPL